MTRHYVLTESAAHSIGIIDDDCISQSYDVTEADVSEAAESSHTTLDAARAAAREACSDGDARYVIDDDGDSHYVAP